MKMFLLLFVNLGRNIIRYIAKNIKKGIKILIIYEIQVIQMRYLLTV